MQIDSRARPAGLVDWCSRVCRGVPRIGLRLNRQPVGRARLQPLWAVVYPWIARNRMLLSRLGATVRVDLGCIVCARAAAKRRRRKPALQKGWRVTCRPVKRR